MTKQHVRSFRLIIRSSTFIIRASSFVIRALLKFVIRASSFTGLSSHPSHKKWVMRFLFAHRCHWPVTRANDRLVRQCQDFLAIVS